MKPPVISTTQPCCCLLLLALAGLALPTPIRGAEVEKGFSSLFDGQTLNGWKLVDKKGDGYGVTNGAILNGAAH